MAEPLIWQAQLTRGVPHSSRAFFQPHAALPSACILTVCALKSSPMDPRWAGFRKDLWLWLFVAVGLMSGITAIFREWLSVFHPTAADAGRVFNASVITCFFLAAVLVFFRQRSTIASLGDSEKRDRENKADARRLHDVFGDFMTEGEALAGELRQGLPYHEGAPVFGPWLQRRQEWVRRASDSLRDMGLPDDAAAFRHAVEGDPDINQLVGPNQSVYWYRFYGGQLDKCREKLADVVARRVYFHL